MPDSVTVTAAAKVNLYLDITGVLPDGYHAVDTVMQSVGLCDTVTVARHSGTDIRVTCDYPGIPQDEGNIAFTAARAFFAHTGAAAGLNIRIGKQIPAQAGLAGGSADAAAVITGLNTMFGTGLSIAEMRGIGARIGADVPFCMAGGCMRAGGKGDVLEPLPGTPDCITVIAKPQSGVDTKSAYARYDALAEGLNRRSPDELIAAMRAGDIKKTGESLHNVFEQVCATAETPVIREIYARYGALGSAMTGSGSAVTGLFPPDGASAAKRCAEMFREKGIAAYIARPVDYGVKVLESY